MLDFCILGKYVWTNIFKDFCALEDLLNFDSSVTNKENRKLFLNDHTKQFVDRIREKNISVSFECVIFKWLRTRVLWAKVEQWEHSLCFVNLVKNRLNMKVLSSSNQNNELYIRDLETSCNVNVNVFSTSYAHEDVLVEFLKAIKLLNVICLRDSFVSSVIFRQMIYVLCDKHKDSITTVDFRGTNVFCDDYFFEIASSCVNLENVFISQMNVLRGKYLEIMTMVNLQVFSVENQKLCPNIFQVLKTKGMSNLKTLNLNNGFNCKTSECEFVSFLHTLPSLTDLSISDCVGLLTDTVLLSIVEVFHVTLTSLDVGGDSSFSDAVIDKFCSKMESLKILKLVNCSTLSFASILHICKGLPELRDIQFRHAKWHVVDVVLLALSRKFSSISLFDPQNCRIVGDLVDSYSGYVWFETDEFINMPSPVATAAGGCFHRPLLLSTFDLLKEKLGKSLTSLTLESNISSIDFCSGCFAYSTSSLKSLVLHNMSNITDENLIVMSKHCATLESISLSNCKSLTGLGVSSLLSSNLNLLSFTCVDILVASDFCVNLGCSCVGLRSLTLRGCPVSEASVQFLGTTCLRLRDVRITSCKAVIFTQKMLDKALEKCPEINSSLVENVYDSYCRKCFECETRRW
jgi:hypothetical protein